GTASNLKWALHSGLCNGLDAFTEVANGNASGVTILNVTPATDYRLLVFNTGGPGVQGTFSLNLEVPGINDASISQVTSPSGLLCDTQFQPVVKLKNLGETTLSSVQITVKEDAVTEYVYNWSGPALAFGDSVTLTLPLVTSTGSHTLNVNTDLPNGAADDIPSNDLASSAYQADGQTAKVRVTTDNNPGQTTWIIYAPGNIPVASGGPYVLPNTQSTATVCLPSNAANKWFFFLFDSFGDGICCSQGTGSWQVLDRLDRVIMRDNGQFTTQSPNTPPLTSSYSAGHEITLPIGPTRPWTTSPYNVCGVFNLGLQSKIRCTTVSGVTSYQWEFSNPDAGYQRRVSASTNFVTYVNMQAMAPQLGITYFVRNRADQGTAGFNDDRWGEGCEMAWSNTTPFCTGLVATAGSTFSCGATRTWGGSSKIWATPVVGAYPYDANGNGSYADAGDQQFAYHFRFTGPGAYVRDIYTTNYICPLAWTTNPLVAGNTYQVTVEVQVGGVWRGFCGSTCNLTIAAGPGQGAGRMDAAVVTEENISLWPNPVRDGLVNLRIDGITDADQRIAVDIYDAFGKKVVAQQYANSGNLFNTVLHLDGGLAAGVYMVNITINDRTSLKRLTVL
ncbi:MAG: T9SS type A sorting domain-containing protein, partial [Flavobacteriales bacterium]|nr:T9SS type A sorting domain-containing protein [Flavobacteriales bacterium]